MTRIIQIGFNKCGTGSLHQFFRSNGLRSAHYQQGKLANTVFTNYSQGRPLLAGLEQFDALTDMEWVTAKEAKYVANRFFRQLHAENPQAVFVLNTRNVDRWLQSRLRHNNGSYLSRYRCLLDLTSSEIMAQWEKDYFAHIEAVTEYFKLYPDARFVHIDIDNDSPEKLGEFLVQQGYELKTLKLPHSHKTQHQKSMLTLEQLNQVNQMLDIACVYQYSDPKLSQQLFAKAIQIDPHNAYCHVKLSQFSSAKTRFRVRRLTSKLKARWNTLNED